MVQKSGVWKISECNIAEALISRHPQSARKVSVTGAGCLQESENTEFVWEFNKTGFWPGGHK